MENNTGKFILIKEQEEEGNVTFECHGFTEYEALGLLDLYHETIRSGWVIKTLQADKKKEVAP